LFVSNERTNIRAYNEGMNCVAAVRG
jgi:hypothetical protein